MASVNPGLDRWEATFVPEVVGAHPFRVRAWIDHRATFDEALARKVEAGVDGPIDHQGRPPAGFPARTATTGPAVEVEVELERALFSAWYELFPRSLPATGADGRPRTPLAAVVDELDELADLGFDIVYLPPIHPIGRSPPQGTRTTRPRPGPTTRAAPGPSARPTGATPRSTRSWAPWPIFDALVAGGRPARAGRGPRPGLPVLARPPLGAASTPSGSATGPTARSGTPRTRPSATRTSIPSTSRPRPGASCGRPCSRSPCFWCDHGIEIFRVDNPHTKPFAFWEWLIAPVRAEHPDVIFLAEAFTRPKVMTRLAKVGFTQTYTYFTWRTGRDELAEYFGELAQPAQRRTTCGPTSGPTPPTSCPGTCRRPRSRPSPCAWCWPPPSRPATACTARPSTWATTGPAGNDRPRSTSTRRSTRSAPGT